MLKVSGGRWFRSSIMPANAFQVYKLIFFRVDEHGQVAMQTVICFHKPHMKDSLWQTHCTDFKVPRNSAYPSVQKIRFQARSSFARVHKMKIHRQMFVYGCLGPHWSCILILLLDFQKENAVILPIEMHD